MKYRFIFVYKEYGLKIGYDRLMNFCVFDDSGKYSNIFELALSYKSLLKMSEFPSKACISYMQLSDVQVKWLGKYIGIIKEAQHENNNLDA